MRRTLRFHFHSFRVTWVTLPLTAGVPLELVQKVSGHKTPKEEMRELIDAVKQKALHERLLKVWAKW